ncbi:MAG: DUF1552 domain-containing protein [Myxococcales bacterium]|nr:DUF1552 domain-containing protein [Myxococcales bacterium]MCB9531561.1 DUF1552 domain-containing protein [Myxococcales bacterium]MCB9532788.1 DUF1552 domain-containing protein [Myxococcales bacterium]
MKTRLSRRTLLRGMLGGAAVTIGLPPLEIFFNANGNAYASGGALPRRFGLYMWGNGILPPRWIPSATGADYTLSEQLAPLEPVKSKMTVVTGFEVRTPNTIPHFSGAAGILTGRPVLDRGDDRGSFPAPSIDQVIAAELGGDTRFRSLEFGALGSSGLSYNGPDNQNPPETSPAALFERVFGAGFRMPGETVEVDPRLALRRSVLDAVGDDITRVRARLGTTDQARLDQHLTGVRELELRIARLEEDPPDLAACARPAEPLADYPDIEGRPQIHAKNRALAEIAAMALACDQTRVFSNFLTDPVSNHLFEGATDGHHRLTHDEPGDQPQVNAITIQLMSDLSAFLQQLDAVQEGDGTLLDNCIVLGTSDVSLGRLHAFDEFPLVIAGSGCGTLKTGFHHRSVGDNASRVPLTIMRALGMTVGSWGADAGEATDSVGDLEA